MKANTTASQTAQRSIFEVFVLVMIICRVNSLEIFKRFLIERYLTHAAWAMPEYRYGFASIFWKNMVLVEYKIIDS